MRAFGAPEDVIAEAVAEEDKLDEFEIHEDNATVIAAFVMLQTQWRIIVGGMGVPIAQGIDYASVPFVFDMLDIPKEERMALFEDLRIMETAAVVKRAQIRADAIAEAEAQENRG